MREVGRFSARGLRPDHAVLFDGTDFLLDGVVVSPAFLVEMGRCGRIEWAPGVDIQWVQQAARQHRRPAWTTRRRLMH